MSLPQPQTPGLGRIQRPSPDPTSDKDTTDTTMPTHLTAIPNPTEPDHTQTATRSAAGWEPPVSLGETRTRPEFPTHTLTGWLGEMVEAVAEATQTPPDLAGCVGLAALSTAAGGRALARPRTGWDEPVNIYTVVALPPATRKTPVFRAMTRPLQRAEAELLEKARPVIEQARLERKTAEATQEKAERQAVSKDGDEHEQAMADALDAALQAQGTEVPDEPRLIADDLTPETAASMLAQQNGRIAVLSAEGGIFAILAGRYSGTPNLDVFLKGHGGDMIRIDRKGRPSECIDNPAITLGLTVQPAIIDELSQTALFRGSGLLARFLYSLPDSRVGRRLADPPPVPEHTANVYDERLRNLVHTLNSWTDPAVLAFTAEANQVLIEMHNEIEPKLDPQRGEWAHIGDWAGKQIGQTVRLAALLHLAAHPNEPWTVPVEADTVSRARELTRYFTAHALAVFDRLGADPDLEAARTLLDWIQRTGQESFTKREAHRANRGERFRQANDLNPALALLEDHGHIAYVEPTRTGPGRPPSPRYYTHPIHRRQNPGQNGHN
ncbi:Protein of unknown function [Actinopolyspora xinjiangensis]|uniref:DUF3987 domain-containing protein n=1 Tax=Actinopolyspora xinjiangensis TaxID=405564 RepID=A0A1H0NPP5_9ACTN|nr:YfjI family protein [Actinopolyspora xinjiangensis]SDO94385.1 Protein of unknown function [Actinopolyspora xinjiangensis]